jgi:hypothetical protein
MSTIVSLKPTFSCNQVNRLELVQRNKKQIVFDYSKGIKPALTKQQSLETSILLQNKVTEIRSAARWKNREAIGHILLAMLTAILPAGGAFAIVIAGSNPFLLAMTFVATILLVFAGCLMWNEFWSYAEKESALSNSLHQAANSLSEKIPFFEKMALQRS